VATKEMLVDALKNFEGTMIFVSHDRMFLRGLGSRVLELGGETGKDRHPRVYPGSYVEYVQAIGYEAPGICVYLPAACPFGRRSTAPGAAGDFSALQLN
jgi:hypothetical protein